MVVVVITIVLFIVLAFNSVKNHTEYNRNVDLLTIQYLNLRRFEQQFLIRYNDDPGFFTTGKNTYLKKFSNTYEDLNNIIDQLKNNKLTKSIHLEDALVKIELHINKYHDIFNTLSDKLYKLGDNKNGIIGELKVALKVALAYKPDAVITNNLLESEILVNSYLFDKKYKRYEDYLKKFQSLNSYLNSKSSANIVNDSMPLITDSIVHSKSKYSEDFIKQLNTIKSQFTALIKLNTQIGTSYKKGLMNELRTESKNIYPKIDVIRGKIQIQFNKNSQGVVRSIFIFFLIIVIIIVVMTWRFSKSITVPLNNLQQHVKPLSQGILPENAVTSSGKNEIVEMTQSINELIDGLKKTTEFASTIGKGIFNIDYKPLSGKDELGNSLIEMRQNLNQAQIEESKRKKEDDMRKWSNEGLAKFNDILRQNTGNTQELSNTVIKELVDFLRANQGGLFVYNSSDINNPYFELSSAYAYGHEKKKQKRILPGEGLIGTAAIEKETVYMTDIPASYITITSGLGQATPRSLLIVPMKVENEVFGVIEIASFNQFKTHEIEFVEKVSENIAASLSISRINSRTAELLEQSQLQAEQMAAQEEEMRQNFEELQGAQEESAKREAEMTSILSAINSSSLVFELDTKGYITSVNDALLDLFSVPKSRLIGKLHQYIVVSKTDDEYAKFWINLRDGKYVNKTERVHVNEDEYWLSVIYAPIKDDLGQVLKILCLATDLTESKRLEFDMMEQAEAMSAQEEEMRQNLEELHSTQEEMSKKQNMLEETNLKFKENEKKLKKTLEISKKQEQELHKKVFELNEIQNQLQEQQSKIILINQEIAEKESEIRDRFNAVDRNNLVAEYSMNGTLIYANETFQKTFGYKIKEIQGRHHRLFVQDDDKRSQEYIKFWQELRYGNQMESECRRVNKTKNIIFFRGIYVPIKDQEGKPYKVLEILTDITKLKYAEARFSSQMLSINNTNIVVEFDKRGNITSGNTLFCDLIGHSKKEVVGMHHSEFMLSSYTDKEEYRHFWRDLGRGEYNTGTFTYVNRFSKKNTFQGTYSPLKDPQGKVQKIMFLAYDITESLKQKEELLSRENELEQKVKTFESLRQNIRKITEELDFELEKQYVKQYFESKKK